MHSHTSVVRKWGLDDKANFIPTVYGCLDCDVESPQALSNGIVDSHTHTTFVEGCFGCKAQTLQLATGDAKGDLVANGWTNKKWDSELNLYRQARAQGIQPDGTSTAKIRQAMDVSDKTGHAYGSTLE